MKKVAAIIVCILCFACAQSEAQTISTTDSLKIKLEQKRIADSIEIASRQTVFEKRRDSIDAIMKQRQEERIKKQDSIRNARLEQRKIELQNKRDFINRKKEREQIRDSIARESKKAAAARKAYRKSLKKKQKSVKKKEPIIKVPKEQPKKKDAKKEKQQLKEKVVKEKKEKNKDDYQDEQQKAKDLAKQKTAIPDSLAKAKKQEENKKRTSKSNVVSKDKNSETHYNYAHGAERPEKKKTFFSFQLGVSNYVGDLGGNSRLEDNLFGDVNFRDNTFFYGFSFSHLRYEAIGIRVSYVFGSIAGSDKNTYFQSQVDPSYNRYVRNLDFRSKINEGSLMLELYPFKFLNSKSKLHKSYLQPYFLGGVGTYSFNPQGSYYDPILDEDVWVDLQPLGTEGQGSTQHPDRESYKLSQWNIPYGFGFNYELSRTINLGLEFVSRKLFTDYLDDVSTTYVDPSIFDQNLSVENAELAKILNNKSKLVDAGRAYSVGDVRGNPNNNDLFFSISGRISIKLNRNKNSSNTYSAPRKFYRYDDNEICE